MSDTFATPRVAPHRNRDCRLREFTWRDRRCVSLENQSLRVVICVDKGCDILEFTHKPTDTECLHQAPAGLTRPADAFSSPLPKGAFRDHFPGGWYVMLPNGPEPCTHRGADYGFHGEATLLAWNATILDDHPDRVSLACHVRLRRTPLLIERRFTLERESSTLVLNERITNESSGPLEVLWGHHPTFGDPLVEDGARIFLPPAARVSTGGQVPADAALAPNGAGTWPWLPGRNGAPSDLSIVPDGVSHDFVRADDLASGWCALFNPRREVGFALRWDETLFPMLGLWRLLSGGPDYPWYGARRMIALEPACDLPSLAKASAAGTAVKLEPGQTRATRLEASVFTGPRDVTDVEWGGAIRRGESA